MQNMFIKRLVELMEERDMSQIQLSRLIGTTNVTISRYISGERKPRIEIVGKIAEVLGCSTDYLLGISDTKILPNSKKNPLYQSIYDKLDEISNTISKKQLSTEQIMLIEKLLDTNQDFLLRLNPREKNIS